MTMIKFATFTVLSAQIAGTDQRYESSLGKTAHRHNFIYDPKPGYLYVRSRAISSRTNDNYDTFPAHSIKEAWRTFIGKPVFVNHSNANHRRARGVIIDAAIHEDTAPDGSADTWVEVLHEIDAVKFPKLAEAVLKGYIDRTSMGTEVAISTCSYCGNSAANPAEYCRHIPAMKGQRITRTTASGSKESVLISEICEGLSFFENSLLVEAPADPTAIMWGVDTTGLSGDPTTARLVTTSSRRTASLRAVVAEDIRDSASADALRKAYEKVADARPYLIGKEHPLFDFVVTYRATGESPTYVASTDDYWHREYWVQELNGERVLARSKSPAAILNALVRIADKAVRTASLDFTDYEIIEAEAILAATEKTCTHCDKPHAPGSTLCHGHQWKRDHPQDYGRWNEKAATREPTVRTASRHTDVFVTPEEFVTGDRVDWYGHPVTIIGDQQNWTDQFGRTMLKVMARDESTGKEGWILFGPGANAVERLASRRTAATGSWFPDFDQNTEVYEYDLFEVGEATISMELVGNPLTDTGRWEYDAFRYDDLPERHIGVADSLAAAKNECETYVAGGQLSLFGSRRTADTRNGECARLAGHGGQCTTHGIPEWHGNRRTRCMKMDKTSSRRTADIRYGPGANFSQGDTLEDAIETAKAQGPSMKRVTKEEFWCGFVILKTPGDTGYRVYNKDAWDQPAEQSLLPWSPPPPGEKVAEVDVDGNVTMLGSHLSSRRRTATRRTALGEQTAPPVVDTLRIEACPVCGDPNSFNGTKCEVCGYIKPPALFDDPDLEKAKQVDLRGGDTTGITPPEEPNSELECNSCGATFPLAVAAKPNTTGAPPANPAATTPSSGMKSLSAFPKATPVAPKKPNPFAKKDDEDKSKDKDKPQGEDEDQPAPDDDQPEAPQDQPEDQQPPVDPAAPVDPSAPADPAAPAEALAVGDTCPTCQQGTLEEIAITSTDPVATPASGGQQGDQSAVPDPTAAPVPNGTPDDPAAKPPKAPAANPDPAIGDRDPNQPTKPADDAALPDKAKHPDAGVPGQAPVDDQDVKDKNPNPFDKGGDEGDKKPNPFAKGDDEDDSDSEDDADNEEGGKDKKSLPPWMKDKKKATSHRAERPTRRSSVEMARNPAQVNRNRLIEALRTQQRQIAYQAAENTNLKRAMMTLASAAGVAGHPHFAALRKNADTSNAADAAALAPAAKDDPTTVGGAPAPANTGVTPSGTTDVSNTNVALPTDTFGDMVDVTQQVPGTEGPPVGDAAHVETDVRVGTPDQTPFPDNSGWTKASREDPSLRLMASLRLAKMRITAGFSAEGDEMSQGQVINDDRTLSLAIIQHEINTLAAVASVKAAPVRRAQAARSLVPQRATAVERTVPSLSPIQAGASTGSTDGSLDDSLF